MSTTARTAEASILAAATVVARLHHSRCQREDSRTGGTAPPRPGGKSRAQTGRGHAPLSHKLGEPWTDVTLAVTVSQPPRGRIVRNPFKNRDVRTDNLNASPTFIEDEPNQQLPENVIGQ